MRNELSLITWLNELEKRGYIKFVEYEHRVLRHLNKYEQIDLDEADEIKAELEEDMICIYYDLEKIEKDLEK